MAWQTVRFLILNYYLLEAVLSSTFYSMFVISTSTLMPLNLVLFLLLLLDLVYKFLLVEKPTMPALLLRKGLHIRRILRLSYYFLVKHRLGVDACVLAVFYSSYLAAFPVSRFLRLAIVLRVF